MRFSCHVESVENGVPMANDPWSSYCQTRLSKTVAMAKSPETATETA